MVPLTLWSQGKPVAWDSTANQHFCRGTLFQPHRYHDVMSSESFLSSAAGFLVSARNG
jgi:hypothetical protein